MGPSRGLQIPESGHNKISFFFTVSRAPGGPETSYLTVSEAPGTPKISCFTVSRPPRGPDILYFTVSGAPVGPETLYFTVSGVPWGPATKNEFFGNQIPEFGGLATAPSPEHPNTQMHTQTHQHIKLRKNMTISHFNFENTRIFKKTEHLFRRRQCAGGPGQTQVVGPDRTEPGTDRGPGHNWTGVPGRGAGPGPAYLNYTSLFE